MDWANLPLLATEKIIFFAAEKERKQFSSRSVISIWENGDHLDYFVDRWIEILCKYGQVCPQWKEITLESKLLASYKRKEIYMVISSFMSAQEVEKQVSFVRQGYMKIADSMWFWFGTDTVDRLQVSALFEKIS